jgi:hypothetical protein
MNTIDDTEAKQAMLNALAGYTGPITHCPDGEATAEPLKMVDDAAQWLKEHRRDRRYVDPIAMRKRLRLERAKRGRIERRNAAIMKKAR